MAAARAAPAGSGEGLTAVAIGLESSDVDRVAAG